MGLIHGEIKLDQGASTDCRDEVSVTVGLIDAIISVCRVASNRELDHPAVKEALKDLRADPDLARLLGQE